ncbi:gamma-glutamyl-gamma-aminobutyrate hydrolase family protein [Xylanibacter muris]|uniref:C26 family cysteine hydrolase domain-containing family n=1 Tax=Xylanibacter muris TaxID=2736290 RepID=A0ABX2ALJ9_9BACT|nr:gamma-glutamyl-gamma-aminobutyrate hydrolase family protein [Xylanibacter muris]NPD90922.1 C26 family cysteine hydrolase domain-containing family [Xylanibacter muris]
MDKFDWQHKLADIYSSFPEGRYKPIIGITANHGEDTCKIADAYYKSIVTAGGIPVVIPPLADKDIITGTLKHIDGLVLSGGGDYNPLFCGEEPSPHLHSINSERDLPELIVTRLAYNRQIPILGICRGIQTLAMALGGKVAQDISEHMMSDEGNKEKARLPIKHSQDASRNEPTHSIRIEKDTILHTLYNKERMAVNSFHHQAVTDPGDRFRIAATAPDGVTEAIESREFKSIIGVQWHPECLENGAPLFSWLVKQAANFHEANELHERILTLDTHCDTPMLFPQGIKLSCRNPQSLVDLHKMDEGRQDATIMVAYLPQPKIGETFSSKVEYEVDSPTEYADLIFDKIEEMVLENKDHVSIARTPADLYGDKRHKRKSIMLGIENGLAINGSLTNLKHFAQRGIVYITLCHNGDNDICDSAKGCNTHNGVSRFGEQVILEMNRLGIMADLSHGSEKSFYDALEISRMPIVCSHSSSYSLCNHPRNLTDDQMRALAAKGGVAQTTLYHGFLNTDSEATVLDAIAHLEHAIKIMGIDHVGIGTDFDGDGGIRGFSCSSEAINFTRLLLSRRYSEQDIQKIWGGNFLRVMTTIQSVREG